MKTLRTENCRLFILTVFTAVFLVFSVLPGCHAENRSQASALLYPPTAMKTTITRVGTVKRTELLVAYYGSAFHRDYLQQLREEQQRAREAGDDKLVTEIENTGRSAQELAHRQLAGRAPLTNITEKIGDILAEVASENDLDIIIEEKNANKYENATIIDVTEAVISRIPPAR